MYCKSLENFIKVIVSFVEPKLIFKNLLKSSLLNLPYPSTIFNVIEVEALLICDVKAYNSSFGKVFVILYTSNAKQ